MTHTISKEVNIEMLEKLPDGTYKLKYPKTRSASGITFDAHLGNKANPHGVTKSQVDLGSVQNYGLATKQEAETGTSNVKYMTPLRTAEAILKTIEGKVDKVAGKALSTNDYTTAEKNKLNGIQAGAQVNTVTSVAGRTGAVSVNKSDVGLSNVDNVKQATKVEHEALDTKVTSHLADSAQQAHLPKNVGLGNVDNVKQMPIAGSTFTGISKAHSNTSYTVAQMRNIILSTGDAVLASMQDGDVWIMYK